MRKRDSRHAKTCFATKCENVLPDLLKCENVLRKMNCENVLKVLKCENVFYFESETVLFLKCENACQMNRITKMFFLVFAIRKRASQNECEKHCWRFRRDASEFFFLRQDKAPWIVLKHVFAFPLWRTFSDFRISIWGMKYVSAFHKLSRSTFPHFKRSGRTFSHFANEQRSTCFRNSKGREERFRVSNFQSLLPK